MSIKFTTESVKKNNFPDEILYYVDSIISEDGHKLYMLGGWGDQFLLAEEEDIELVTTDTIGQNILNVMVDIVQTLKANHHTTLEMKKQLAALNQMKEFDEDELEDEEDDDPKVDLMRKKRYTQ